MMKLSILLVCYNHEQYIEQCLQGIIIQKAGFDFEVVIADDYSTDQTVSIIKDALNEHKIDYNLLESAENLGLEGNYKRGFKACRGEYIAVMEGDDYWTNPNRLQKHIDFLDSHRECSMSFNRLIVFNEETSDYSVKEWLLIDNFDYITSRQLASGNQLGNLSACVFRNDIMKKLKPELFEIKIADWMLAMAFGQFGFIGILKDAMSVYRIHKGGLWSKQNRIAQIDFILENIDMYNKYLDNHYNAEFIALKRKLKHELHAVKGKAKTNSLIDYIPPLIIGMAKALFPIIIIQKLKKLL